ncbi:hypothetical protein [Novosphingobium panipatense]|uniref:hypothetical protein n=1 Tax=Novosphingobium panipatense TaxID=428991 RepID=UPI00362002B3
MRPLHLLLFLVTAIALRIATFGDPNLHVDESFYQTVGIAMHEGAIPMSMYGIASPGACSSSIT